jgi:hypothetical protein
MATLVKPTLAQKHALHGAGISSGISLPLPEKTNPITDDTDLQAWKWACLTFFDQCKAVLSVLSVVRFWGFVLIFFAVF